MEGYWPEFIAVAIAHLLAVASPGPDFAVVIRQSLCRGLAPAIWTSIGIGMAILVHVTYSLFGLGLLISQSVMAFSILKWVGAIYLAYVGWQCLKAKPHQPGETVDLNQPAFKDHWPAFRLGFLTNLLNPKATLFFVALFSVIVSPDTPKSVQAIYGIWMCVATAGWFVGLSVVLSLPKVRAGFERTAHWVERFMGVVLFGLAARLFVATRD